MLVIGNDITAELLPMSQVVEQLELAYEEQARGDGVCHPRIDLRLPVDDTRAYQWGVMGGGSTASGYVAVRMKSDVVVEHDADGVRTQEKFCVRPGRFCGLVLLLDTATGEPVALLNDGVMQHLRVGADSAIGTRYAAREDARVLGVLGSGGMARSHVAAISLVRPLERVVVFSPTTAHREAFAAEVREQHGLEVDVVDTPEGIYDADIVAACTDAVGPVVRGRHLRPGSHVVAVGGGLDAEARGRVDVWLRLGDASAAEGHPELALRDEYLIYRARPGDVRWQQHRHGVTRHPPATAVSLAEVLPAGTARSTNEQITFSERGNVQGAQFHRLAGLVFERARSLGLGYEVPRDLLLQDIRD
ncbi:MAG: hypothetical protein ACTHNT_06475 [Actinomycetales bacterium]